jgi:hypothetical protein
MSKKSSTSFVGHPTAFLFLRISGEGVFQHPQAITLTTPRWVKQVYNFCHSPKSQTRREGRARMNWKRFTLGVLTALAMMAATYALPRGGALRDASLAQFPLTVGVWAIFVLLFVKLK